jgi:tol-pal system protein YbgF
MTMTMTRALLSLGVGASLLCAAPLLSAQAQTAPVQLAQYDAPDTALRLNRVEERMRQLTGQNEELQHQVKQLQDQIKRLQGDIEFRLQDLEKGGGSARPQRRSDASDAAQPDRTGAAGSLAGIGANTAGDMNSPAPGPQNLGSLPSGPTSGPVTGSPGPLTDNGPGAPLVLAPEFLNAGNAAADTAAGSEPVGSIPDNRSQAALTAPPSNKPDDQYALAKGFLEHRDYDQAAAQFQEFLNRYPKDTHAPDALYGLGEANYQRGRKNEALEPFLKVVTEYGSSGRAPQAMLRLGQTLGSINQKEQACATLAEVGRKYPRSSSRPAADKEMGRLGC